MFTSSKFRLVPSFSGLCLMTVGGCSQLFAEPPAAPVAKSSTKARAHREGKQMVLKSGDTQIARFQAEPGPLPRPEIPVEYTRGGYVAEFKTPNGVLVTDDFAVGHVHHHGIWTAWTKTVFQGRQPDFWNMGQKKGRMQFLDASISDETTISAKLSAVDMLASPELTVLEETWTLTGTAGTAPTPHHALQLLSSWTNRSAEPLMLPKYHYGGFGFRGHAVWNGEANMKVLTSEGETDRVKANTLRAKWCWVGGLVEGKWAGVVLMDHPSNFRHPQPMRIHPKEPFFCYAPQQAGEMAIEPGKPYLMTYQAVAVDGQPDAKAIESLWQAWASHPPDGQ